MPENLHAHVVPTPEYRKKVVTPRVAAELRAAFEEVCGRYEITLDTFRPTATTPTCSSFYPPKVALSTLVLSHRTSSSARALAHCWPEIRQALRGEQFWSPSYCMAGGLVAAGLRCLLWRGAARGREGLLPGTRTELRTSRRRAGDRAANPREVALDPSLTEGACAPAHGQAGTRCN